MADMTQGQFALLGMSDAPADGNMQSQLSLAVDGDTLQEPEPSGMPATRAAHAWAARAASCVLLQAALHGRVCETGQRDLLFLPAFQQRGAHIIVAGIWAMPAADRHAMFEGWTHALQAQLVAKLTQAAQDHLASQKKAEVTCAESCTLSC